MNSIKLTKEEIDIRLESIKDWILQSPAVPESPDMLFKMYPFEDFTSAKDSAVKVAKTAENSEHYPAINFTTNYVNVILWSPELGGLTEKDFKLAKDIDKLNQPAMAKQNFTESENE